MTTERPQLTKQLDSKTFRDYYYLKEELVRFCRENHLPTAGGKIQLTNRIAAFLDTGKVLPAQSPASKKAVITSIDLDTEIETPFVCSQRHRAFFQEQIGKGFSFSVAFQQWLKNNPGKTYQEAILAYGQLKKEKKKTFIDKQFEYNTYIRDFFADNQGKSLAQAIQCWKAKKQRKGHNRYERADLVALNQQHTNQ